MAGDTPDPADGERAATAPARKTRRTALLLAAIAAVLNGLVTVLVTVLVGQSRGEPNPLDSDAPALANFTMQPPAGCRHKPERGGLVVHFDVSTRVTGRFTVEVQAVTEEGVDNLDISTPHAVRVTLPFHGGHTRKEFDVVVPLTEAVYRQGYRKCRYTVNPTE